MQTTWCESGWPHSNTSRWFSWRYLNFIVLYRSSINNSNILAYPNEDNDAVLRRYERLDAARVQLISYVKKEWTLLRSSGWKPNNRFIVLCFPADAFHLRQRPRYSSQSAVAANSMLFFLIQAPVYVNKSCWILL